MSDILSQWWGREGRGAIGMLPSLPPDDHNNMQVHLMLLKMFYFPEMNVTCQFNVRRKDDGLRVLRF